MICPNLALPHGQYDAAALTLINSVLSSLPMYMMSFFEIPKEVRKKLDYFRSRFFWQNDDDERKYRLAKWNILCQPKDQGD